MESGFSISLEILQYLQDGNNKYLSFISPDERGFCEKLKNVKFEI
jgi:hypothetical protein